MKKATVKIRMLNGSTVTMGEAWTTPVPGAAWLVSVPSIRSITIMNLNNTGKAISYSLAADQMLEVSYEVGVDPAEVKVISTL